MKNLFILTAFLIASAFVMQGEMTKTEFKVSATESTLQWLGKKVTGQHDGNIKLKNGSLSFDKASLVGGQFEIDMASITCNDLKDEGYNKKLIGHLKSADFFDVEKHPTAKLSIKSAKYTGQKATKDKFYEYDVTADLTIKGITNEVKFKGYALVSGTSANARGTIVFDRSKFDVRYGSKAFFADIGDKMIYDDVEITVLLKASK